ncbi:hypothetical protein KCU78_g11187, partial [Aureobasidium melanogenum]
MVISTKKTSSSTKAKTSSSASRSSISKSLTSTSIKPSSSTKSSSKILSLSQPSVRTTTSSKSSSMLLNSSKSSTTKASDSNISSSATTSKSASSFSSAVSSTSSNITKSSSSTSSATATKTPTARTDGQFYLRVANATAPPNDWYVYAGEDYYFEPSPQSLFKIDSNGYLYSLGYYTNWIGLGSNLDGRGYIENHGGYGQYSAANLRCTYDDNYLLSCATASTNGNLVPVIFTYDGDFDLMGLYGPSDFPTMNLYVELAVPSTSSTTSSSGSGGSFTTPSTISFTIATTASPTAFSNTTSSYIAPSNATSSLAIPSTISSLALSTASSNASSYTLANASATASPTVAPTCTLIPRVANGGFEDGKNQTAWSTIDGSYDSYGSWAPTTTNPYDGALSGQFTFQISDGGNVQASTSSVRLRTTLSNLCPGFKYSISYNSFCAALSPEKCFIALWTTETSEWGESFSSSSTGSGWLTSSDNLEFAAASSTSTLYVYVGTVAHNDGVGTIYLDDVSITLSENQDIQDREQKKILEISL